ncbi:MAG: hypothetical protein GQ470_01275 [Gammaproteobacteria bacterium]|nr:hypothetical protein [Gammaproteobacteria bacterium]
MAVELSDSERIRLGELVTQTFDLWGIKDELQVKLLGLPEKTKARQMTRYRHGQQPLPQEEDLLERAKHILGIQHSLELMFPLNKSMPNFWLRNRNRSLKGIPLIIMLETGLTGMGRVWGTLDCTQNWED